MTKNLNLFMNLESWKYNQKLAFQEWKYYQDIYLTSRKKLPLEMLKVGQILIENLDFRKQLSTVELKIQLKIGPSRPKRKLEHFRNDSKKTLKKSKIRLFDPRNCKKWPAQMSKFCHFDRKSRFSLSHIVFPKLVD